ncbi:MAG: transcriptional regulator, TetR family [Firmicutes bacterium]|nr:transcriptional regulator, TetR family [Bacillota bacterium]
MTRVTKDPQIRKTEILDTAEALFNKRGYHHTAISDIVREIGVAQGTFYYYFKSKEEVLEALVYRHLSGRFAEVETMISNQSMQAVEKFSKLLNKSLEGVHTKEGLLFEYLYSVENLHILDKVCHQAEKTISSSLLQLLEEGVSQGVFKINNYYQAIDFIMSIMRCLHEAVYKKYSQQEIQERLSIAIMLVEKVLGSEEGTLHLSVRI